MSQPPGKQQLQQKIPNKDDENEPLAASQQFKSGEYLIHVLVEQTRGLINQGDATKPTDPLIQIDCFQKTKFSKSLNDTGTATTLWNEHFYFTQTFSDGRELQGQQIKLTLLDHHSFGKDAIVGTFEIDFTTVYLMENHALLHKWLGLINAAKDFNSITGYLKVSINIVGTGDKQVPLVIENDVSQPQKNGADNSQQMLFGQGELLLPPHIQIRGQQLRITLGRAESLMKMDRLIGTIDPYITFDSGAATISTLQISSNQNPTWEIIIQLPVMTPSSSDHITMRLFDYDFAEKDQIVSTSLFATKDIKNGVYSKPGWVNLYGANIKADSDQRILLCSHPDLGTQWAGRIIVAMDILDSDDPVQNSDHIKDPIVISEIRDRTMTKWDCFCDVYYGLNLPEDDGKYSIKLRWADLEASTSTEKAQAGLCEYFKALSILNISFPYKNVKELPDLFVYLMKDDVPICYIRYKPQDLFISNQNPLGFDKVVSLLPDESLEKTDLDKTGILKIRLGVQKNGGPIPQRTLKKPEGNFQAKLYVNLFQAQDLLASDLDGSCDPECDAIFYNLKATSAVISDTLSPIWNSQMQIPVRPFSDENVPPIILRIYDKDKISRDFIGQCLINFNQALQKGHIQRNSLTVGKPGWFDVKIGGGSAGRVLASFNYFDNDPQNQFQNDISPKTVRYFVKIKALGLRNLKSFGVFPVSKPYLKFDLKSVRRPDDTKSTKKDSIITQPKDSSANPNIQSIITFELQLPEDEDYMPKMQCFVQDYMFKGLIQPVLGTFQLDLKHYANETMKKIKKDLDHATKGMSAEGKDVDITGQIHLHSEELLGGQQQPLQQSVAKKPSQNPPSIQQQRGPDSPKSSALLPALDKLIKIDENLLKNFYKKITKDQQDKDVDQLKQVLDQLKQFGILVGDKLCPDQLVKYISYQLDQDQKVYFEVEKYPEEYFVGLGYDTQQNKADLSTLQAQQKSDSKQTINQTQQRRLNKLQSDQQQQAIFDALKQQQVRSDVVSQAKAAKAQKDKEQQNDQEERKSMDLINFNDNDNDKNNQTQILNTTQANSRKHYRFCLPCPLEQSVFMTKNTFDEIVISKGIKNPRTNRSIADMIFGSIEEYHVVGQFKGWINLISESKLNQISQNPAAKLVPEIVNFKPNKSSTSDWDKELVTTSPVIVRVYIIDCFNLPQKDANSDSDPYICVRLGDQKMDNESEHQTDTGNPKFYKMFQLSTTFPGASDLSIQIYDYDFVLENQLIGETIIDLESRFFQKRWRQLTQVPIETRQLYHPSSSLSQGVIRLFVEIVSQKVPSLVRNPWFIEQRPSMKFEVRVVVWNVYDVPSQDDTDTSDLYVVGYINDKEQQKTDKHYFCQDGTGCFNWRMIFPLTLPCDEPLISFQVYDHDIFSADEYIADCTFDMTDLAKKAFENEMSVKLLGYEKPQGDGLLAGPQYDLERITKEHGNEYEKVEIATQNIPKKGKSSRPQGKIVISLELVPESIAKSNPVGLGQASPNHSPFLPFPPSRFKWSWNPFTMLTQVLGPKAKLTILLMFLVSLAAYMFVMYLPVVTGDIIANKVTGK